MTEQKNSEAIIIRLNTGITKQRKRENEITDDRIEVCINKYDSDNIIDFLKNISLVL